MANLVQSAKMMIVMVIMRRKGGGGGGEVMIVNIVRGANGDRVLIIMLLPRFTVRHTYDIVIKPQGHDFYLFI